MARFFSFISILSAMILFSSCVNSKKITYFQNVPDSTFISENKEIEKPLQSNDILSITVSSPNAEASAEFNKQSNSISRSTTVTGSNTEPGGYLINPDGKIDFPMLGLINAAGLTKDQLKANIVNLITSKKLLLNPIVDIRFLNFEVTVIGEVARPTVITVPSEKISLVKAIGLAGDLTIYGKRNNVLLIRQENGKKITRRIDLTSSDFFNSPYYYLQANDVIYVEPNRTRAAAAGRSQQLLPIFFSALSVMAIVLDRVLR